MKVYRVLDRLDHAVWAASANGVDFTRLEGAFPDFHPTGQLVEAVRLLAPVEPPPAIWCVGLNYHEHARETGLPLPEHPILFLKPRTCLSGPADIIELPRGLHSDKVDYELELTVVIGKSGKNIPKERALEHVFGYTIGNDVSARDWQKIGGGGQWVRGKSFDTACPVGPCVATPDEVAPLEGRRMQCWINGERRQSSSPGDMVFGVADLIAFISRSNTLEAGSLILTGTPHGVGFVMKPRQYLRLGDHVRMEIEGIGILENTVGEEILEAESHDD
ncbi:MAG: fumarylacetoacetate hydrolase family protein [Opitutales bacterium]